MNVDIYPHSQYVFVAKNELTAGNQIVTKFSDSIYPQKGLSLVCFHSPISLKPKDVVFINKDTLAIDCIQRGEITIWRRGWLN